MTPTMRELMDFHQWVDTRLTGSLNEVDFTEAEVTPGEMEAEWDLNARLLISTA